MKVLWSNRAQTQLDEIFSFISKDSPLYAARVVDSLLERTAQIADFPRSGRKVSGQPLDNLRELIEGR